MKLTDLPPAKRWPPKHPDRIQLYSLGTPNGMKVAIALEEMGLSYEAHRIDIGEGDQFTEEFVWLNPNSKIPAIIDPAGPKGEPHAMMESGAILLYLAEKSGNLVPNDPVEKSECLQWLFFQVAHVGPMFGQFGHFFKFAVDKCDHPYPKERYTSEARRLLAVLENRLNGRKFILGDKYSIVDIMIFPWVVCLDQFYKAADHLKLKEFPTVMNWVKQCAERPASQKGMQVTE